MLLLGATAVLVVVGGLGAAWIAAHPATAKGCILSSIDAPGAGTPEAARVRWAAGVERGINVERPDRTSGSGDHITATYLLDPPKGGWTPPDRTHYQELVTDRGDDGVWRVTAANRCEEWTP
ncbi:MAG: hypothetical protein JWM89_3997 [Acidimicrobiales bacterium]|nr:hypothetical protein [Acidimicrobiales bacterium]